MSTLVFILCLVSIPCLFLLVFQFDPEDSDSDLSLPTKDSDEFRYVVFYIKFSSCQHLTLFLTFCFFPRPFARRLPEFKFWYTCTRAVILSFFMTFFELFDVPVFWPILLLYFIVLFFITMKRQINHMIKYRYVPFSFGKQKYTGKGKDGK
ncbi:hypothetical protein EON65_07665 [archaeon]|nr:MAG: hypothetical protein EON65_07665 [archaeon]